MKGCAKLPKLLIILDEQQALLAGGSALEVAYTAASHGARFFMLRHKALHKDEFAAWCAHAAQALHSFEDMVLSVHGEEADLAHRIGAHALHLTSPMLMARGHGNTDVFGASTHHEEELEEAHTKGAAYATLSPVFLTHSKPGYGPALGLDVLHQLCAKHKMPVYALGGVTPARTRDCVHAGAYGVAIMGGVMRAHNVGARVRAYLRALS